MSIEKIYSLYLSSTGVCTDTRKIESGQLFFALKGPNFNGNNYAAHALASGAAYAIVDEANFAINDKYILVHNVLETLQSLATHHRRALNIPVIGVAGSNGKTTTKELLYAVLSKKFSVFATKGNLNNHIGVPLSLLSINKSVEIAVLELGANHVGELELLCKIAEPSHGLVTNNGLDHLEGYGSFEGVVQGNSELYYWLLKHNGTVFVNGNDEILMRMASRFANPVIYGRKSDVVWSEIVENNFFIKVKTHDNYSIQTRLVGEYNIDNINSALCIAGHFKVSHDKACEAIAEYSPANNRSQLVEKGTNKIILDCYNANPSSMKSSIESFANIKTPNKALMLGDMFEMGDYSIAEHKKIVELVTSLAFEQAFFCGNDFYAHKHIAPKYHFFEKREQCEDFLKQHPIENTSILIKGSRGMVMEKLVDVIS